MKSLKYRQEINAYKREINYYKKELKFASTLIIAFAIVDIFLIISLVVFNY